MSLAKFRKVYGGNEEPERKDVTIIPDPIITDSPKNDEEEV